MESTSRGSDAEAWRVRLERAVALDLPYPERLPGEGRTAAVLALWAFAEAGGEPSLLLTRRTETLETHKGQIAFPGGATEPEDRDAATTALRESCEEVGIDSSQVEVAGALPVLWTVTGFLVTPVVAIHRLPLERIRLVPNPDEIAELFWVPLETLREPGVHSEEPREWKGRTYRTHVYQVGDRRIWGATAAMVKNLLDRLDALG